MPEKIWSIELDADGKITSLTIKGKKKAMRDLNKAQATTYWRLFADGTTAYNRFGGGSADLDQLEFSIYTWCLRWYERYERGRDTEAPIQTYDSVKYILLALNPSAYMTLLD